MRFRHQIAGSTLQGRRSHPARNRVLRTGGNDKNSEARNDAMRSYSYFVTRPIKKLLRFSHFLKLDLQMDRRSEPTSRHPCKSYLSSSLLPDS
ncbi:hypothetical protein BDV33DRAFT_64085 [Aspergillus novoparasiticus]|uniref:Uncharacterized protein n=1 Tax=Aspergillus novoparasiticus TaxID=986946 RepID=A0A5N6E741_9EURO|nr:hypothetical protein BDV33DRAFT_64085 [Aspergillus novoparasiticus]